MKKAIALLCSVVLMLSLCACDFFSKESSGQAATHVGDWKMESYENLTGVLGNTSFDATMTINDDGTFTIIQTFTGEDANAENEFTGTYTIQENEMTFTTKRFVVRLPSETTETEMNETFTGTLDGDTLTINVTGIAKIILKKAN